MPRNTASGGAASQPPPPSSEGRPRGRPILRAGGCFPRRGEERRHPPHETVLHRATQQAVREAGIATRATCHTLHHSFATNLLEDGDDVRTLQELLGHTDVATTMVSAHVLNRGGLGVRSPADWPGGASGMLRRSLREVLGGRDTVQVNR